MIANIRAEMSRHNLTNANMAKHLHMSENSFSFKLNEKREFTLSELAAIAMMFNVSIDYLVAIRNDTRQDAS